MQQTDAVLVEASLRGDPAAFGHIVERYQRAVYATSYSAVRDHALSDDITQDTFVTAWRRLGSLRDLDQLPAWLCGIARNLGRDARKRRGREVGGDAPDVAALDTPFEALSDAESERLVAVALDGVPEAYREPLVLFYYEQRSVKDVARALGIGEQATHQRLSRGRQYLAGRVAEIVERGLARRGPARTLGASVLAAIGTLGIATSAEAAPISKGSTLAKVVVATVLTTTLGGIGLLSAGPSDRRAPAASTTRPAHVAPVPPSLPARESVVPDCAAVGRHMAELKVGAADPTKQLPAQKRALLVGAVAREITTRCKVEAWNDNRRVCVAWATDIGVAKTGCSDELAPSPEEAALPAEMLCPSVAKHVADLMTGPGGKLALFAKKSAAGGHPVDVQRLAAEVREQQAAECERAPWSAARRRCILASTTHRALGSCVF